MLALQDYASDSSGSEEESKETIEELTAHLKPVQSGKSLVSTQKLNAAPLVITKEDVGVQRHLDITTKEVKYNPKFEEMFAPQVGPSNPFKTQQMLAKKNMISGYAENAHFNQFQFENQRRTFTSYGYAVDPSVDVQVSSEPPIVGDRVAADDSKGLTVFEAMPKRPEDKRKRLRNSDAGDVEGYLGPWGKFVDEKTVMKPSEDEQKELDEILAKRSKTNKQTEEKTAEEKTTLHIKDAYDYQGRSYLHIPQDVGVNLKSEEPPEKCFLPKKHIHTWTGHTKGLSAIRWFPVSAHLLLSCSMDCKIKIWEVYNERRCIRTYTGHKQAVRDITFNNEGTEFLSCGYDRYCKLWDTETGECKSRFSSRKVPYCVKFHPEPDKQHLFVAGTSDKKIVCWDIRSGEIVQEYDRHLGAVNTITFVDQNRRFVSSSDDKSLRVWEWDIPVDFKYIADPSMHSMPAVTLSPNGKWLACQSMDNKVSIFNVLNRFKYMRKKTFTGHMVAGYACNVDFSPDMSYIISGDADGKLYVWDWKTTKLYSKFKAHDDVCISVLWHPHETSKVATAGWDGIIKYWD
ncbi:pre-mRNA-processing factor 17-like [Ylistrum balloti]|uniref:pre-mRNA-processing factor 17-like n=1 Tax=Ylistrum balloti TaxID=509963 RepID=UPI002905BCB5|nr:pre-mRNA-processing factor 17-like [Ylistrum balloti]